MVSRGALERSNNPHIASIVETFVSKNQKEILVGLTGNKILKKGWGNEKQEMSWKV